MLYKIRQGPADVTRFSEAKRLADDALRDLRTANDRRHRPEEADYIAEIGLENLTEVRAPYPTLPTFFVTITDLHCAVDSQSQHAVFVGGKIHQRSGSHMASVIILEQALQ